MALVLWFFKGLDLAAVGQSIAQAHWAYVALTLAVTAQTYVIRAWRWQHLLSPIGRARYRVAFRTTVIGFATTFLLPGRIGEVLRPYLLARSEGLSTPSVFATVIIERVLDLVSVLLLFGAFVATTSIDLGTEIEVGAMMAAVIALVALGAMILFAGHPDRLGRWTSRITRLLPARLAGAAEGFTRAFSQGLVVMRRPGPLVRAFVHSILLWLSIALGVWLMSQALEVRFPFTGSFLVLVFLVIGVAAPTPAGVGAFHWAYRSAVTTFFAADVERAAAAAIALHAATFIPVALVGLLFMAQDGLTLGGLRGMRNRAAAEERPVAPATTPELAPKHEEAS